MPQVLLVTNDFPPTLGGIQSYLRDFVDCVDPRDIVVFASTQDAQAARRYDATVEYKVVRWPRKIMLPTPATIRRMQQLIREHKITTVWFGAAAPLGLMARYARQAGAQRIIATTHGHEVGWGLFYAGRKALATIGKHSDVITYISEYTRPRMQQHFGTHPRYAHVPSGVDAQRFRVLSAEQRAKQRTQLGFDKQETIVCISRLVARKGQDMLIRALPQVLQQHPQAHLVLVGGGPYERRLRRLVRQRPHIAHRVTFTGRVTDAKMQAFLESATVFAMPCRTRGGGLDVEGLGIVFLEAQACGVPVIVGDSGGAPETITAESGIVVDGRNIPQLSAALCTLLHDATLRERLGKAGRAHVSQAWTWEIMGARMREVLGVENPPAQQHDENGKPLYNE